MDGEPTDQNAGDQNAGDQNAGDQASPWPSVERLAADVAERLLAASGGVAGRRVLVTSTSRGQAARVLAEAGAHVTLLELEQFRERLLVDWLGENSGVEVRCDTDPPDNLGADLAILALRRDGTAELARDLLQSFAASLSDRGTLMVVTDHPDDQWLGDQLRALSSAKAVKRYHVSSDDRSQGATGYSVRRSEIRLRYRDFTCQFAFRDSGRLIHAVSRPGVFSHRRLDLGARRLIDAMRIEAGDHVLEIGCGSGVVALAAALRAEGVRVTAIDSSTRAIQCTRAGAELNGVTDRLTPLLSCDGSIPDAGTYDVAVANPPYFAHFRIAELFLDAAQRALRPGGQLWIVGKQPDWYQANVPRWFDRVKLTRVGGGYCVATGTRPAL